VSSRRPVPSVLATAETPSSVPPDPFDLAFGPKSSASFGLIPIVDLTLDNLAEPSQRIDEDAPACAGVVPVVGCRPMLRAPPDLLVNGPGRAGLRRIQEGNVTCPSDRI
jgi:hypothetical protein